MIQKWLIVVVLAGSVHTIDTKMKFESTWMMASDGVIATGVGLSGGIIAKKYNCIEILAILEPYALLAADDVDILIK